MIINHNLNSLNAQNRLTSAYESKNNAMKKLSSGLRINSASDDAANSGISEKMKAQIRGLQKAENNVQDAISFVQIADGAMGNITDPNLMRLRELAVQAANGAYSDFDRSAIQDEASSILSSIESINNDTNMNNIQVFRPTNDEEKPLSGSGKAEIVFVIDATGSMSTHITKVKNGISNLVESLKSKGIEYNLGLVIYKDINEGDSVVKYEMTSDTEKFKENLNSIISSGGGDFPESGLEGIMDKDNGAFSYPLSDDITKKFIMVTDAEVHTSGSTLSKYDISSVADELKRNNITLDLIGSAVAKNQLNTDLVEYTGGNSFDIKDSNYDSILDDIAGKIIDDAFVPDIDDFPPLGIQIGANFGDTFEIKRYDLGVKKLGIEGLDFSNRESAEEYITKIDEAISKVNQVRSKYGAYQNTLEHISNGNRNYGENIASANSRIMDADMAKETIEFSKFNILQEAAQSMLSQANKMKESVLNLMSKWQEG